MMCGLICGLLFMDFWYCQVLGTLKRNTVDAVADVLSFSQQYMREKKVHCEHFNKFLSVNLDFFHADIG